MKMTVILDETKECLGIVYGHTLEECLAEAVNGHNGEAAKAGLLRWAANPPRKRQTVQRQ